MFSQRATVKINDGHQRWLPEGSRNLSIGASCTTGATFTIHRQQVTVIKCFFISSQATTKGQNRIKQSGGILALLMLRAFENVLAMRGGRMLQARIMEQRDVEIPSAVWEPSSSCCFYLSTSEPLLCFQCHHIRASITSLVQKMLGPGARTLVHIEADWRQ